MDNKSRQLARCERGLPLSMTSSIFRCTFPEASLPSWRVHRVELLVSPIGCSGALEDWRGTCFESTIEALIQVQVVVGQRGNVSACECRVDAFRETLTIGHRVSS